MDLDALSVRVNLGERSYDIVATTEATPMVGLGAFVRQTLAQRVNGRRAVIITDTHAEQHAFAVRWALEADFKIAGITLEPGERQKSLASASRLYDQLAELTADRQTLIVAVGGGVIGDLAGFVAATYARGLALLMVPTTLLAMVDSSVGGKVGVNHPRVKNLIGAFHQPVGVWIETGTLSTLPDREYRSGLAEVVKYGVILDAELFEYLEGRADPLLAREPEAIRHVVARSCRLKADVVEKDERELTGLRAVLNYGHTFAHAFETAAGYGTWLHGEAVAAGMVCAATLAEGMGLIDRELTDRQLALLRRFGLPTRPERRPVDDLLATMRSDKKSLAGKLRLVLPRRLGDAALFDNVSEEQVRRVLESLMKGD